MDDKDTNIKHIGFIMDGNRRYAKKLGVDKSEGYKAGLNTFLKFVSYQIKHNIYETSFFALSEDNVQKRGSNELEVLGDIVKSFFEDENVKNFFISNKIKVNLIGDIEKLENHKSLKGKKINKKAVNLWNLKNKKHKFIVNILMNYGGASEIINATKEISKRVLNGEIKIESIDNKLMKKYMWTSNSLPPQIIVRTGDCPRLSGFLLWDSKYSEIYFTHKLWPQMDESDFVEILDWYKKIQRNFGK